MAADPIEQFKINKLVEFGQVNLPLLGRLVVPSQFGERFAIGHVHEDGRDLFVTPGIGTSILPVRFGAPPEISVLTVGR